MPCLQVFRRGLLPVVVLRAAARGHVPRHGVVGVEPGVARAHAHARAAPPRMRRKTTEGGHCCGGPGSCLCRRSSARRGGGGGAGRGHGYGRHRRHWVWCAGMARGRRGVSERRGPSQYLMGWLWVGGRHSLGFARGGPHSPHWICAVRINQARSLARSLRALVPVHNTCTRRGLRRRAASVRNAPAAAETPAAPGRAHPLPRAPGAAVHSSVPAAAPGDAQASRPANRSRALYHTVTARAAARSCGAGAAVNTTPSDVKARHGHMGAVETTNSNQPGGAAPAYGLAASGGGTGGAFSELPSDVAHHVKGCHLTQETMSKMRVNDVASIVSEQALVTGHSAPDVAAQRAG